jgi:hypothetical protein
MIPIKNAEPSYERSLRKIIQRMPDWYRVPARVSLIRVDRSPEIAAQVAMYRHKTRDVLVTPGVGRILERAMIHEFGHAVDDGEPSESAHRFSRSDAWMDVWRNADGFEITKYRDEPQEYFADMVSKAVILGVTKLQVSHSRETSFITDEVVPTLRRELLFIESASRSGK